MSFTETAVLGAIAGFTIYLGLPLGRMSSVGDRLRVGLAMLSVGILAFIFMDVTTHAEDIVSEALSSFKSHTGSFAEVLGLFAVLGAGFAAGVGGISAFERRLRGRAAPPPIAGGATSEVALDAALTLPDQAAEQARRRALHTGMVIAIAIGLHNFAEGLAIGVSAGTGAIGLATVLIIGFGLHNATEGFGIVGPLGGVRPSWKWLALAGLVGGGPTFLGTLVG
ncbi:MAG TPA: ZIP family metal transporter, partial [Ramlibacter sp.]|nr:ZIP family metal transporter [Ramlibacter sp.]